MLPITIGLEMEEALEDQEVTTTEVAGMMESVFGSAVYGIVLAFGMLMFYRVIRR